MLRKMLSGVSIVTSCVLFLTVDAEMVEAQIKEARAVDKIKILRLKVGLCLRHEQCNTSFHGDVKPPTSGVSGSFALPRKMKISCFIDTMLTECKWRA